MAPKILVVLTSVSKIEKNGKPTGWYLPELAHPYEVLAPKAELVLASPAGGVAPLDPSSVEASSTDPSSTSFLQNHKDVWENTLPLASLQGKTGDFDALFYPGGHGPMFDLAVDSTSQAIIKEFWDAGKPVAAVCHGPAVFLNVKLDNGEWLLKGKQATGFSNMEEDLMQLSEVMPFMLETEINDRTGGSYVKADEPWGKKVVVVEAEGGKKLITGQNPASAKAVGEAIAAALGI